MVRKERLELSQVTPLEPKSSASTNSATFALKNMAPQPRRGSLYRHLCVSSPQFKNFYD